MDFTFNDEQTAVSRGGRRASSPAWSTPTGSQEVEATEDRVDRELWAELAQADLLGLAVPDAPTAAAGYGLVELCLLLEAQGGSWRPVPLWATLVLGRPARGRVRLRRPAGRAAARRGRRRRAPDRGAGRRGRRHRRRRPGPSGGVRHGGRRRAR